VPLLAPSSCATRLLAPYKWRPNEPVGSPALARFPFEKERTPIMAIRHVTATVVVSLSVLLCTPRLAGAVACNLYPEGNCDGGDCSVAQTCSGSTSCACVAITPPSPCPGSGIVALRPTTVPVLPVGLGERWRREMAEIAFRRCPLASPCSITTPLAAPQPPVPWPSLGTG